MTGVFDFRLYVAGKTAKSTAAFTNLTWICQERLEDKCHITVIDILRNPRLAKKDQIIAAPTLIKKLPLPLRRLIGDMSDTERFLVGIDLKPKNSYEYESMSKSYRTRQQLLDELQELTSRMMEVEETLRAIRGGEVDGLVVSTAEGDRVFTLMGAEHPYRVMVETMNEGAMHPGLRRHDP